MATNKITLSLKSANICSAEGCKENSKIKGFCKIHYLRMYRHGSTVNLHKKDCSVTNCNRKHYGKGLCSKHHQRLAKNGNLDDGFRPQNLNLAEISIHFWQGVATTNNNQQCWEWQRRRTKDGYGAISWQKKQWLSHRFAWFLTYGEIPKGLQVLHSCDNPPCCNPFHLNLGTIASNMAERSLRNRQAKGAQNGKSKLTEQVVKEIIGLLEQRKSNKFIAHKFNVNPRTISDIKCGKKWKHITLSSGSFFHTNIRPLKTEKL